jgi:hypothetical protein
MVHKSVRVHIQPHTPQVRDYRPTGTQTSQQLVRLLSAFLVLLSSERAAFEYLWGKPPSIFPTTQITFEEHKHVQEHKHSSVSQWC